MADTLYKILGLKKKATKEEIRAAFKTLAKKHHSDTGGDDATFIEIKRAHDVLMDDKARADYDRYGIFPGDPESTLTLEAAKELRGLLVKIVQSNPFEAILQTDIVAKMREIVTENVSKFQEQVQGLESKIAEPDRIRGEIKRRLKCSQKRAPEMMLEALDELIAPLEAQKAMAEGALTRLNRMLELLEDYSFNFDAPPPRMMPMQMMSYVTVTGGTS
jgi:curved DNA-binding protein CbpA